MIPSVVAAEVADALGDFLATGFGPSNAALAHVVDDFLAQPENLAKGPYLSVALPFQQAPEGGDPFPDVTLGFTPYRHQRTAFSRLAAGAGRSTVVATGTGSGKTECFLYPILDHCRERAGTRGIKAIVIYPMNALAADQARRIAEIIDRTPALRGKVTAGVFVGRDNQPQRSAHKAMGRDHVITDRDTLRDHPPDILLTNYKMLDYLLVRPFDFRLWRHNEPDTLRYLVVDELHTFDGAQGTDLACLIRRLRVRLGVSSEKLICAGSSATLGDGADETELLDYVSRIFGQRFEPGAIVGETRQSIDAFLGDAVISRHLHPADELATRVDPTRYATPEAYVREQHALFFGAPIEGDFASDAWRLALADRLREHSAFVNLLRVLEGRPTPMSAIVARLRHSLPVANDCEALWVLNGLCALISEARRREETGDGGKLRPFLQVGLHLWVRELRRMVCSLHEESTEGAAEESADRRAATIPRRLRFFDDLKPDEPSIHLPLIQCRECHVTGWGAVKRAAEQRLERDLRVFYNRFFLRDVDVVYLFPVDAPRGVRGFDGFDVRVCGACGTVLAADATACSGCRSERLVHVFRPHSVEPRGRGKARSMRLSRDCPYCGAREALIIFGARAASLLSVALGQAQGSRYNDDRKVIAFSDNVQDAAHRAGFFAARTASVGVRAAVAQVVERNDGIALADLPARVETWWRDTRVNPEAFDDERFVSEFIAPDRLWRRDFATLQRDGRLPAGSRLPEAVAERLRWDTLAELGYRSAIGRTLERTRAAALGVDREALERAVRAAQLRIREKFGTMRDLGPETVRTLVLGVLRRMKDRGAIRSDVTRAWLAAGGRAPVAVATTRAAGLRSAVGPACLPGRRASRRRRNRTDGRQQRRTEVLVPGLGREDPDAGRRARRHARGPGRTAGGAPRARRRGSGMPPRGRAGRARLGARPGALLRDRPHRNAFTATVATGQPHDLYYYAEPLAMLAGRIEPPGVFLNAPAVLERQLTAFCLDGWAATGLPEDAVPRTIRHVLDNVEQACLTGFPYPFLDFVQRRADLLETFCDALVGELTGQSRDYLTAFLHGDDEALPSLRSRMVNRLLEIAGERKALRADVEALGRRIQILKRAPADEATNEDIEQLGRERGGLQAVLRRLNGRETFNFLTDEGLLPNYAFPEAGVTLKSVIYRSRVQEEEGAGGEPEGDREVYEYVRPAASALGEFAPDNEFYAGGNRVSIDRIDLRVSPIETWRLCPSCDHCERVDVKDDHVVCPRCGDVMWSDAGQRREMLPLRMVHAATPDRRARILDERDDLEPLFFTRQLAADFEAGAVKRAYALAGSDAPFGFEYIESATFREMNFGRLGRGGQPTAFAGLALPRDGFRVCRRCGTVQKSGNDDAQHTLTCSARKAEQADIADCLYLYREFQSEAVQMLLPVLDAPGSERRISSFVAAL